MVLVDRPAIGVHHPHELGTPKTSHFGVTVVSRVIAQETGHPFRRIGPPQIQTKTYHHDITTALDENPSDLEVAQHDVVGPLQPCSLGNPGRRDTRQQRKGTDVIVIRREREGCGDRAVSRYPLVTGPPPTSGLVRRHHQNGKLP